MTEKEAIDILNNLDGYDVEGDHMKADQILLDFLSSAGFSGLAEAFVKSSQKIGFWYA